MSLVLCLQAFQCVQTEKHVTWYFWRNEHLRLHQWKNKQACCKLEMEVTWHEGILGNVGVLGKDREKEKSHHPCDETNHTGKSKVLIKFKSLNINTNKENLNQCPSSTD